MRGVLTAVALVLALLLSAGTAEAQTSVKLVGNTGKASDTVSLGNFQHDRATAFTTGSHPSGYTLTEVKLRGQDTNTSGSVTYTVSIHEDSSNAPGTLLVTLTNPASLPSTEGEVQFATPMTDGIDLAANTTYWLVVDIGATTGTYIRPNAYFNVTDSDDEDTDATTDGSISDSMLSRNHDATAWEFTSTRSLKLAVHGYANPLVSTLRQPTAATAVYLAVDYAQAFTTGSHKQGYTLTGMALQAKLGSSGNLDLAELTVGIYPDTAGTPGTTSLGTLEKPASLPTGDDEVAEFAAPSGGLLLAPNTTYWVVLDLSAVSNDQIFTTTADAEDAGAAAGWRMANTHLARYIGYPDWISSPQQPIATRQAALKLALLGSLNICRTTSMAVSWATGDLTALAQDCNTLLDLMDTLRGTASLNWSTDTRMDQWDGLTATNSITGTPPRVRILSLTRCGSTGCGLTGSLPPALGDLDGLTYIEIHNIRVTDENANQLSGPIPPELGNLTHLTHLNLGNNRLSGPIPPELGNLTHLTKLDLYNNDHLTGSIPVTLGKLTSLTGLGLSNNHLTGSIPKELGDLTSLGQLWLNDNRLTGQVPSLSNLTALTALYLHNNQLTSVSSDESGVANLPSSLVRLALSNNRLTSVPDLSGLSSPSHLYLGNNQLTSVSNLPARLTTLDLSNNQLDSVPTLTSLRDLYLGNNKFTSVPGNLPSDLKLLDLSDNQLTEVDGASTTNGLPSGLTRLDLRNNQLTSVSNLPSSLERLDLRNNQLTGVDVSGLTDLEWLDLRDNQLTSAPSVTGLNSLVGFWLSGNEDVDAAAQRPTVDLSVSPTTVSEGAGTVEVTVTLSAPVMSEVALKVAVFPGTADEHDYMVSSRNQPFDLVIPASDADTSHLTASTTTDITLVDDEQREGNETFEVAIEVYPWWGPGLPATVQPGDTTAVTVTIRDDDGGGGSGSGSGGGGSGSGSGGGGSGSGSGSGGGGSGSGSGGRRPRDDHGNSASQATRIPPSGRIDGQLHIPRDVDYFTLTAPYAGMLVVETTGAIVTRSRMWQAGQELDGAGPGPSTRLTAHVEAGPVVIGVAGNGRQIGAYVLRTALVRGQLENPRPASFQSGIGLISGWVCEAEGVTIEIEQENGEVVELEAAYGTARADTAGVCGDTDTGFGLLFNWNLLGDGEHEAVVLVDGIELGQAPVTVTTLGEEFRRGLTGRFVVADFPRPGEQVHLVWHESQQNFVLAPAELGAAPAPAPGAGGIEGVLENPAPASFQSGIGVISGWVCEADEVVIELDGQPIAAAAGTERADTLDRCGDRDNGFGLLVNWAEFGAGAHEVVALVDGVELSRATVTVTVVDETEPFVRGLAKRAELPGFPTPEETVTVEWQQSQQNFVITGVD